MAKNPEKRGGIVLPVLMSLLAAAVISGGGFGVGFGVGRVVYGTADQPLPALEQTEPDTRRADAGSAQGPNVHEENGVITWLSDRWPSNQNAASLPASTPASTPSQPQGNEGQPASTQPPAGEEPPASQPSQSNQSSQSSAPAKTPSSNSGTSSSGSVTLTPNKTQTGVNVNPSSSANTKTQTGGNNQTSNLDWPEGKFLASKNGKVYHRMYCERGMTGAVNIKEENKIWFDSEEEARAAGKERCGNCW